MKSMGRRDKINIYASSNLSIDDYASLSLLYQPLIGTKALGIYQMLFSLLDRSSLCSETFLYCNILDLLGKISDDEFNEARLRLEGVGLIETFKKNDIYAFLIKMPLSPSVFLNDTVFGAYLLSEVGQELFDVLVSKFKIVKFDRLGYDNITSSFDDIFESSDLDMPNINGFVMVRKNNKSVDIQNHNFDFELFEANISEDFLRNGMTPQIRKGIIKISYVYGFNENEMEMLFNKSIAKDGFFDLKILERKAAQLHKHNSAQDKGPSIEAKKVMNDEEYDAMNAIANSSWKELLAAYWPDAPDSYLSTISKIHTELEPMDRGVVNIMIFYTLKKKGELPSAAYFKKIADTWIEDGIVTREDAWLYVRGLRQKSDNTASKPKSTSKVKSNEYSESFKNNLKNEMEEL